MSGQPTIAELEQLLAGELDETRAKEIEREAKKDPTLEAWLTERKAEIAAFRSDPRRRSFSSLIVEAEQPSFLQRLFAPQLRPVWGLASASLVAASVAFVALAPNSTIDRGG